MRHGNEKAAQCAAFSLPVMHRPGGNPVSQDFAHQHGRKADNTGFPHLQE
jgi:hypothetical protein